MNKTTVKKAPREGAVASWERMLKTHPPVDMTAEAPPTTATNTDNPYGEGEFGEVMRERDEAREHAEALAEACKLVDRAAVGDGVEMSKAIDACLLALADYEASK